MTDTEAEKCCEEMRAELEREAAEWRKDILKQFEPRLQ